MNKSESIANIAQALALFQGEVVNPKNTASNPLRYPKYSTGSVFNDWTVLYKTDKRRVMCQCVCGKIKELYRVNLGSGKSTSCGCSRSNIAVGTKLYNVWSSMKSRCSDENSHAYADYGGRGITVCEEWNNDPAEFYTWAMLNGYKEGLSIDRIDNNSGYSPDNCKWSTRIEQHNNKRNNLLITYEGKTQTVAQWSREKGINNRTILSRVRRGLGERDIFAKLRGAM